MTDQTASDSPQSAGFRTIITALCVVAGLWLAFEWRASQSPDGRSEYERSWIRMLRDPDEPSRMIGPPILEEFLRDYSALGGYAVLTMAIVSFAIPGGLRHGRPYVRFFLVTVLGGFGVSMLLKLLFGRERPAIVPHLSHVATTSFPSGHAMMSLVVYLCIGLLMARRFQDRRMRAFLITLPLCLTALVGFSRVAMGVHYPADVLAGWTAGLTWLLIVFSFQPIITGRCDANN